MAGTGLKVDSRFRGNDAVVTHSKVVATTKEGK
jgi:hypothetical protein